MIRHLDIYQSFDAQIDDNLALEEYLMTRVEESSGILFLWSNHPAVVIGRNQNPWKECDLAALEREGVTLARRKSGGGAVYQDRGNLNITFLCRQEDADTGRQMGLWIQALAKLGITVTPNGRNDLVLENGRKCTGMAFSQTGDVCLMHGTLMVRVDVDRLEQYLHVSADKLVTKGIDSVRSRVGNLSDYRPELSVRAVAKAVTDAAKQIYPEALAVQKGLPSERMFLSYIQKYQSRIWKYGDRMQFDMSFSRHFCWGSVQIDFRIKDGVIRNCRITSDALEQDVILRAGELLCGADMELSTIKRIWSAYADTRSGEKKQIILDMTELVCG